jgi:hypothetical protein
MEEFYSNICIIFATYLNNASPVNFKDVSNFRVFFQKKRNLGQTISKNLQQCKISHQKKKSLTTQ